MDWLEQHTSRIEELVQEGTEESLSYAALRARLALELVCYHRLRVAYDYISADDLQRWQPRDVVNKLIQEVEPKIASSYTMSMGKEPMKETGKDATREDFENVEYVEVGRQAGFDSKRLGKIWNSLGSFLHVQKPVNSQAELAVFGRVDVIRRRVEEALEMLRELQRGTMVAVGFGPTVRFECGCGSTNKRSSNLLSNGQVVSCVNPQCKERWTVSIEGEDIYFERRTIAVACKCGAANQLGEQWLLLLERNQSLRFKCEVCSADNRVRWKLIHESRETPAAPSRADEGLTGPAPDTEPGDHSGI